MNTRLRRLLGEARDAVAGLFARREAVSKTLPVSAPLLRSDDQPIRSASDDLLGRVTFSRAIGNAIAAWTGRESLVIGISGPWGSGKSSVKSMLVEHLAGMPHDHRPDVLDFDPWLWSNEKELADAFFRDVGLAIGARDDRGASRRLALVWREYAALFDAVGFFALSTRSVAVLALAMYLVGGLLSFASARLAVVALGAAGVLAMFFKWGGSAADAVAKLASARAETSAQTTAELKAQLTTLLRKRDRPLIVMIDDVDRLSLEGIRLVLQLVKANANFPNVVFVLLYQRDVIERALDATVAGDAKAYLDKIVQVPFSLPEVERKRLEDVLFAGLNELLMTPGLDRHFDQHRWNNIYAGAIQSFFRTLRDVRRFLNTLSFHVALHRATGTLEVNPIDLVALEVLRVFEPDVFQAMASSREALTGDDFASVLAVTVSGRDRPSARKTAILSIVGRASDTNRAAVQEALRLLFPKVADALDTSGPGITDQMFIERRIGHPDAFDRYFLLATPIGDISQAEIEELLEVTDDRGALTRALEAMRSRGLLEVALDRLDSYKLRIPSAHALALATSVFDVGDYLRRDRLVGSFGNPADVIAGRIVHFNLLQVADPRARARVLEQAIRDTRGVFLAVQRVSIESGSRDKEPDKRLVEDDDLPRLKAACVERLRASADAGELDDSPHLAYLLCRWRDWNGPEEPRRFVAKLTSSPSGAVSLLRAFSSSVQSYSLGDHAARRSSELNLAALEDFVAAESLEDRVARVDLATLDEEGRLAVEALRDALGRKRSGVCSERL